MRGEGEDKWGAKEVKEQRRGEGTAETLGRDSRDTGRYLPGTFTETKRLVMADQVKMN